MEVFFTSFGILLVISFFFILMLISRYKRCPSDKILVIYGNVGKSKSGEGRSANCIHGGAAFVWPVIQDFKFLSLIPFSIEVDLASALSKQNIRVDVPSRFTVGISTEVGVMNNAAERLLDLDKDDVYDLAKDIIFGQLRLVVATMDIEEINSNRDKFLANVSSVVEAELSKIGLKLINVNVTDIKDESGYIDALGKEAAAKAINDAKQSVAEKNRDGSIGEAKALEHQRIEVSAANSRAKIGEAKAAQNERVQVSLSDSNAMIGESEAAAQARSGEAEARKKERIQVAAANARAVEGEDTSNIAIAQSNAKRREQEAEAQRKAVAAEKVKQAKAMEEAYSAEQAAEKVRAERDKATQMADIVIPAEISKQEVEINAEAEAEQIRRIARGEADAILAKREAEAKGIYEILTKQAEGFDKIVEAAGDDAKDAALLLISDKLVDLVKLQTEAIKNIKIDKVTVWDSGGKDNSSTANFLSGLYKSVPPLQEVFNSAGMDLPSYLKGNGNNGAPVEVLEDVAEEPKKKDEENDAKKPSNDTD